MTLALRVPEGPLAGEGLVLRQWRREDADQLVAGCRDPEVVRWTLVPERFGRVEAVDLINESRDAWSAQAAATFCIAADDDETRVLGAIGLSLRYPEIGHIGYWVTAGARGRGIGTEALRVLSRWALDVVGFERLELQVMPGNDGSARLAERVGFRREGLVRAAIVQRGRRRDAIQYALLPGELT